MTTMSLRDELGVREDPDFDITLPPGWSRHAPDAATQERLLSQLKERMMLAHRPDLYGQLRAQVEQSFTDMRKHGVFALFLPDGQDEDALQLPVSLNASIRRAEAGEPLDRLVAALIREHGATPLFQDKRTIRCERQYPMSVGSDTVINHSVMYLTPVPGAKRRRALQLVAGFGRPATLPEDDPKLSAMRYLFDACVATIRWRPPTSAPAPDQTV